jgi:hypothetical protein
MNVFQPDKTVIENVFYTQYSCLTCLVISSNISLYCTERFSTLHNFRPVRRGFDSVSVTGIFHSLNPSSRTMALWSTQPLTEMITTDISWRFRRPVRRSDNLTTFICRLSWYLGASTCWNTQGLSRPVQGLLYLFYVTLQIPRIKNVSRVHYRQNCCVSVR